MVPELHIGIVLAEQRERSTRLREVLIGLSSFVKAVERLYDLANFALHICVPLNLLSEDLQWQLVRLRDRWSLTLAIAYERRHRTQIWDRNYLRRTVIIRKSRLLAKAKDLTNESSVAICNARFLLVFLGYHSCWKIMVCRLVSTDQWNGRRKWRNGCRELNTCLV